MLPCSKWRPQLSSTQFSFSNGGINFPEGIQKTARGKSSLPRTVRVTQTPQKEKEAFHFLQKKMWKTSRLGPHLAPNNATLSTFRLINIYSSPLISSSPRRACMSAILKASFKGVLIWYHAWLTMLTKNEVLRNALKVISVSSVHPVYTSSKFWPFESVDPS